MEQAGQQEKKLVINKRPNAAVSDRVRALQEGTPKVERLIERRISTRPIAALDAARDRTGGESAG